MPMIKLGEFNTLTIDRRLEQGFYLIDETQDSVLLPNRYITDEMQIGDLVDVFVYNDSEDRIVATTLEPMITLNKFADLKVVSVSDHGAFLDWGLAKDLFVPFREQATGMKEGQSYIVYLYLDTETDRLAASSKIDKYVRSDKPPFQEKEEVDILITYRSDIGVNVIINDQYKGVLYENEIFQEVQPGQRMKGFIKKIREDNKIDVGLQRSGYENVLPNEQKILAKLKEANGFLALGDKSSPEEIIAALGMSKKVFKKAIGSLFKQRVIRIEEKGISLATKKTFRANKDPRGD